MVVGRERNGNIRAKIVPAHAICSATLARNNPRCPDVPDDKPTVRPSTVGAKSRSCSARIAVVMARSRSMPQVLKVEK